MNKYLILFFGSGNVGPYINVMAHAVDKYSVERVIFIDLVKSPLNLKVGFAKFLNETLPETLEDLAGNKYKNQSLQLPKSFKTYKDTQHLFDKCLQREEIEYDKLEMRLNDITKERTEIEFIIDVTSVPKRIALEIIIACQNIGLKEVNLFELKNQVTGLDALYHNLEEDIDYEYINFSNLHKIADNKSVDDQNARNHISALLIAFSVSLNLMLSEFIIYKIPWQWLIQHPNSYGIQGAFDFLVITIVIGFLRPAWRRVCWGTGAFAIVVALIQILGSASK